MNPAVTFPGLGTVIGNFPRFFGMFLDQVASQSSGTFLAQGRVRSFVTHRWLVYSVNLG